MKYALKYTKLNLIISNSLQYYFYIIRLCFTTICINRCVIDLRPKPCLEANWYAIFFYCGLFLGKAYFEFCSSEPVLNILNLKTRCAMFWLKTNFFYHVLHKKPPSNGEWSSKIIILFCYVRTPYANIVTCPSIKWQIITTDSRHGDVVVAVVKNNIFSVNIILVLMSVMVVCQPIELLVSKSITDTL